MSLLVYVFGAFGVVFAFLFCLGVLLMLCLMLSCVWVLLFSVYIMLLFRYCCCVQRCVFVYALSLLVYVLCAFDVCVYFLFRRVVNVVFDVVACY